MSSRWFTVDPAKKKKFLNFILKSPKLRVPDTMKLAMFSDEDIADLGLRHFLQRALPGRTVNAMKAHLAGLLPPQPPPPDCNNWCKKRSVDDVTILNIECTPSVDTTATSGVAPPAIGTTVCPLPPQPMTNEETPAALSMAVVAISRCKHHDHAYYKKKAHLAGIPPSLLDDTTTPCHGLMMLATHFFMVERVKKHKFKYKLSSEIIRVGTITEPTSELNNLELQKSTHHHQ
jgi:hypothetical protein